MDRKLSAADAVVRAATAKRPPTAEPETDAIDDAFAAAVRRRFSDTDRRKAQLMGQTPPEPEDEYTRAKRAAFPSLFVDPMPLNGNRPTDAVASALSGPGTTVRVNGRTHGDN